MSHHRYLNVNRLLAIYFAARDDWPMITPMGRDPHGSTAVGGEPGRLMRICVDVGTALEALTEMERAVIMYRWSLWVSREEEDGAAATARVQANALPAGSRQRYEHLDRASTAHREKAKQYTREIKKHEKRLGFKRAMAKLEIGLAARDYIAEKETDGRCGVQR